MTLLAAADDPSLKAGIPVLALGSPLSQSAKTETPEPSGELLPVPRDRRYPTKVLKTKILAEPLDSKTYQPDGGKFTVTAVTPVLLGKMQA